MFDLHSIYSKLCSNSIKFFGFLFDSESMFNFLHLNSFKLLVNTIIDSNISIDDYYIVSHRNIDDDSDYYILANVYDASDYKMFICELNSCKQLYWKKKKSRLICSF